MIFRLRIFILFFFAIAVSTVAVAQHLIWEPIHATECGCDFDFPQGADSVASEENVPSSIWKMESDTLAFWVSCVSHKWPLSQERIHDLSTVAIEEFGKESGYRLDRIRKVEGYEEAREVEFTLKKSGRFVSYVIIFEEQRQIQFAAFSSSAKTAAAQAEKFLGSINFLDQ